jgi:hypothetical protein
VTDGPPFVRGDSLSEMIDYLYYPLDKRRLMSFMLMSLATHGVVSHASPPPQTRSNGDTALCILLSRDIMLHAEYYDKIDPFQLQYC